jgi:hypothetical protein
MSHYIRLYTHTDRQKHLCIDSDNKYQLVIQTATTHESLQLRCGVFCVVEIQSLNLIYVNLNTQKVNLLTEKSNTTPFLLSLDSGSKVGTM